MPLFIERDCGITSKFGDSGEETSPNSISPVRSMDRIKSCLFSSLRDLPVDLVQDGAEAVPIIKVA